MQTRPAIPESSAICMMGSHGTRARAAWGSVPRRMRKIRLCRSFSIPGPGSLEERAPGRSLLSFVVWTPMASGPSRGHSAPYPPSGRCAARKLANRLGRPGTVTFYGRRACLTRGYGIVTNSEVSSRRACLAGLPARSSRQIARLRHSGCGASAVARSRAKGGTGTFPWALMDWQCCPGASGWSALPGALGGWFRWISLNAFNRGPPGS